MKRKIEVRAPGIVITAIIDSKSKGGMPIVREEVEEARDALADQLQAAAANVPYFPTPRNRVRVR